MAGRTILEEIKMSKIAYYIDIRAYMLNIPVCNSQPNYMLLLLTAYKCDITVNYSLPTTANATIMEAAMRSSRSAAWEIAPFT